MNKGDIDAIVIDSNQYPIEGAAEAIERWPYQDMQALFEHLATVWPYYGRFEQRQDGTWEVVTGGWSGCEELVGALMSNILVHAFAWELSKRGGYYEFKIPDNLVTASDKQQQE